MALQTFTAGQVLTAAQVNALQANDYNQTVSTKTGDYVLVAADKGTRVEMNSASAQTITVNTSLFSAGDTLFIQNIGAGICTITAGTATVSTAGSLALAQNAGGTLYFTSTGVSIFFPTVAAAASASGLTLISSTAVSGAVSHSFGSNASPIFTSTYRNYRIIIDELSVATSEQEISFRLRADTTDLTAANYNYQTLNVNGTSVTSARTSGATSYRLGFASTGAVPASIIFDLMLPQLAQEKSLQSHNTYVDVTPGVGVRMFTIHGSIDSAVAYNGFTIFAGTNITGRVSIYGYSI